MTFPVALTDVAAHSKGQYPGVKREDGSNIVDCEYKEGIFVGYRWFEKNKIKPLFPFGHGLSYTIFEYGKAQISSKEMRKDGNVVVKVPVTNKGGRQGAEIVQLYVKDSKSSLPRPLKELKDFKKITLSPSETAEVEFVITSDKLSFFDADKHAWVAEPGEFEILVGSSSADIRTSAKFKLVD
jgi:beta-glucosidase